MIHISELLKSKIAKRLVIYVLFFSSCITLLLTVMQLYLNFQHDVSIIEEQLDEIEIVSLESITNNVWVLNKNALGLQLEGFLRRPDFIYISIVDHDKKLLISKGKNHQKNTISRFYPLVYSFNNKTIILGQLTVTATLKHAYRHLYDTAIIILISQAIKTFLVSLFILFIVQLLITRRIISLSRFTSEFRLDKPLKTHQLLQVNADKRTHDELDQLLDSINSTAAQLSQTHNDLIQEKEQLNDSLNHITALYLATPDMVFLHDSSGKIIEVNDKVISNFGYTREELLLLTVEDFSAPGYSNQMAAEKLSLAEKGQPQDFDWLSKRKDGSLFPSEVRLRLLPATNQNDFRIIAVVRDISLQKQYEQQLIENRDSLLYKINEEQAIGAILKLSLSTLDMTNFLQNVLEELYENVTWINLKPKGAVFLKKENADQLVMCAKKNMDLEVAELCGNIDFNHCLCGLAARQKNIQHTASINEKHTIQYPGMEPHGHYHIPLLDSNDNLMGVIVLYLPDGHKSNQDEIDFLNQVADVVRMGISHRLAEQAIEFQAYHDPLTGLPNRRLLEDRLQIELSHAKRHSNSGAILFIDLDNFKHINDSLGHGTGDLLLIEVGKILSQLVRADDTIARLGGDEFIILLTSLEMTQTNAAKNAQKIGIKFQSILSKPIKLQDYNILVTPSIGITIFSGEDQSTENQLKHADTAMYQAKAAGRNTMRFYHPGMQEAVDKRLEIENQLRCALELKQLHLYFQPQYNNQSEIIGAEVLLRWIHPEKGFISPADFIPIAEDTGLIISIGEWIIDESCRIMQSLIKNGLSEKFNSLSINISPKQFSQTNFIPMLQWTFRLVI